MEVRTVLSYAITTLGFLLCGFSAVFMLRGKPIAGDQGAPQVIKYKGLEVRTNAIIMLMLVSVVVAVLPLGLLYYYAPKEPPEKAKKDVKLFITGRIEDESGKGLRGATVTLTDPGGEAQVKSVDADGSFDFSLTVKDEEDRIKLRTEKPGYRPQHLIMGFNWVNFPSVLVKE